MRRPYRNFDERMRVVADVVDRTRADRILAGARPEIAYRAEVSLNVRKLQLVVDTTVNLAAQGRSLWPAERIMRLREPLRRR